MNIVDYFGASVRRNPGGAAVRTAAGVLTYAELDARSGQVCALLRERNVVRGSRVAVMSTNRREFVELILGIAKAGASVVPISVMDREPQVRHILSDSGACVLVHEPAFTSTIDGAVDGMNVERIVLDEPGAAFPRGYADLIGSMPVALPERIDGATELYVGYTSGSTGTPKGVVKTHDSVVAVGLAVGVEWGLRPGFTQLMTMPMCHSGGFWQALFNLVHGSTIAIKPSTSFDAGEVLDLLVRWRVNWMVLVPTMSDALIAEGAAGSPFSDLAVVVSGSAPMFSSTKEGIRALFCHAEVNECYGATETGVVCNLRSADQMRKPRSVGTPILGVDIRIVDPDGHEVAVGEVGEITARSPYTMREYLRRPGETARAIRPSGHVGVGDLATIDDEGFVSIVDRKQDMIITGGLNVYPAEVEEVLKRQRGVRDAIVVGLPDEKWGEQVTAAVVGAGPVERDDLLAACTSELARYKVPKVVYVLDGLPTLVSGKNSRRLVREELMSRSPGPNPQRGRR